MGYKPLIGITDKVTSYYPPATLGDPVPAIRTPFTDPVFGTIVQRVSDYQWSTNPQARHEYSKLMSISRDKTIGVFYMGSGWNEIRNLSTGALIGTHFSGGGLDTEFHTDANGLFGYYRSSSSIRRVDLATGADALMMTVKRSDNITNFLCCYTKQEGRASFDGRWWACWGIYTSAFTTRDLVVIDRSNWTVHARQEPMATPYGDSLSVSPLGNYVVVAAGGTGQYWRVHGRSDLVFQRNLCVDATHADLALGTDGDEYLVYYAVSSAQWQTELGQTGPGITVANLRTGAKSMVWKYPGYMSSHISGMVSKEHPGWVLVSTYGTNFGNYPCFGECFFFNFHTGDVRRVAHHHRENGGYWGEPQALASWAGDAVLVASNWNSGRAISNATNASPIRVTTTVAHGWTTGAKVVIESVAGNTAANGTWTITYVDATNFTLNGSTGNGAYTSGGVVGIRFEDYLITPPTGYSFFLEENLQTTSRKSPSAGNWSARRW